MNRRTIGLLLIAVAVMFQVSLLQWETRAFQNESTFSSSRIVEPTAYTEYSPLPAGLGPFLEKPFTETYDAKVKLHSFFDHRLPIYESESDKDIPEDLRDTQSHTYIFTGESRQSGGQGISWYSGHNGLDYADGSIAATMGIVAPADGVIAVGYESSRCQIWINHDASVPHDNREDFVTFYTHLSNIAEAPQVQQNRLERDPDCGTHWCAGDTIEQGDQIGTEGQVPCGGQADGNHLHFGVVAGALDERGRNPQVLDPFGWWSSDSDPWADERLDTYQTSYWLWAAPVNSGVGTPGYWGDNIAAQTDDTDASFHRFTALAREDYWQSISADETRNIAPIGDGAWWTPSLENNSGFNETWAIWALHVPETATYRIQVHIPNTPSNMAAPTQNATYAVFVPQENGQMEQWNSQVVNQDQNNAWISLTKQDNTNEFNLSAASILLVKLSDVTGQEDEPVVFDAVRLQQMSTGTPPANDDVRRVGFVIDNTSSMRAQGKIDVVRSFVPPWIDKLTSSGIPYVYSLEAFAENVPAVNATNKSEEIKSWIANLSANDNNIGNFDCPEASLGAIRALVPYAQGGDVLFFTDDLPHNPVTEGPGTAVSLAAAQSKLHAIILPKTCWISGGGNSIGWLVYRTLTLTSGGTYQSVSTDKTDEALQIVLSEMETNAELVVGSNSAAQLRNGVLSLSESQANHMVMVDDTLKEINFLLNILEGDLSLVLYRPDGSPVTETSPDVTFVDSGSAQYYQIENPAKGEWRAEVFGSGEYVLRASGDSNIQLAYVGDVYAPKGEMMQLAARVSGPVKDLSFVLETPDGQSVANVPMYDNGTLGDFSAGDGVFTGLYSPKKSNDLRMKIIGATSSGQPFARLDSRLIKVTNVGVSAPPAAIVAPGEEHEFGFAVGNSGDSGAYYNLQATSGANWISSEPASKIYLDAGETRVVNIRIAVPISASPNMVDVVRLTVVRSDNATDLAEASTNVFVPDQDQRVSHGAFLPIVFTPSKSVSTPKATPSPTVTATPVPTNNPTTTPSPTPMNTPTATPSSTPTGEPGITLDPPVINNISNADGDGDFIISWSAVPGAEWYKLKHNYNNTTWGPIYEGPALSVNRSNLPAGEHCYRIRAFNSEGYSDWSGDKCTTVDPAASLDPPVIDDILNADGDGKFMVRWSAVSGVEWYKLKHNHNNTSWDPIYEGPERKMYRGNQPVGEYCFRVRAFNSITFSAWSADKCTTVSSTQ